MNEADRQRIMKKLAIAAWALLTMVLLFCVVLLTRELIEHGGNPLDTLYTQHPETPGAEPSRPEMPGSSRTIALYFASSDGRVLAPELCTLDIGDSTIENCRKALEKMIAGPHNPLAPILPPTVKIRALYLLQEGELVVDFSGEMLSEQMRFKSASLEALMAYAVANTLAQPALQAPQDPPVRCVRFLFEGAPPQESFPAHLDLDIPLLPNARWIGAPQDTPAHG